MPATYLKETDRHMILVEKEGCVEKSVGKEGPLASRAKNNPAGGKAHKAGSLEASCSGCLVQFAREGAIVTISEPYVQHRIEKVQKKLLSV